MRKLTDHIFNEKGMSILEILFSLVILSVIIVSLISFFIRSSQANHFSKNIVNSAYLAQTHIEEIYYLSTVSTFSEGLISLISANEDYKYKSTEQDCPNGENCYYKESNGRFIDVQLNEEKVLVKVYKDSTKTKQEAQIERFLSWN